MTKLKSRAGQDRISFNNGFNECLNSGLRHCKPSVSHTAESHNMLFLVHIQYNKEHVCMLYDVSHSLDSQSDPDQDRDVAMGLLPSSNLSSM